MPRKGGLPSLDQCAEPVAEVRSIPMARFMEAIWVMAVLAGLGTAHIHLRFQMADMRLQHKYLQSERKVLENNESRAERQMEGLRNASVLKAHAIDNLGMRKINLAHQGEAVVISSALRSKYLHTKPGTGANERFVASAAVLNTKGEKDFLQRAVFAFLDGGRASAGGQF